MKTVSERFTGHTFHLVDPSPWPLVASFGAFFFTFGMAMYMHRYQGGGFLAVAGLGVILSTMYTWWRDVAREATYEGCHSARVQKGIRLGVILFIVSELMFFVAFFWAFFHSALVPVVEIGCAWPPRGINVVSPWEVPLLNTVVLLTSGATVTWAHHAIVAGRQEEARRGLALTIGLAVFFTLLQLFEYVHVEYTIADGIFGSTFFLATGFHGFHVLVGTCFLAVCLLRLKNHHFSTGHHQGFEAAAWYWHFVDVVWLFLFISMYWWGGI